MIQIHLKLCFKTCTASKFTIPFVGNKIVIRHLQTKAVNVQLVDNKYVILSSKSAIFKVYLKLNVMLGFLNWNGKMRQRKLIGTICKSI